MDQRFDLYFPLVLMAWALLQIYLQRLGKKHKNIPVFKSERIRKVYERKMNQEGSSFPLIVLFSATAWFLSTLILFART